MSRRIVKLCTASKYFTYPDSEKCLLEVLELHAISVEYQCRSGYCGACRMKLIKGEVVYCQTPLALINDGDILSCCCMPLCDIELDI